MKYFKILILFIPLILSSCGKKNNSPESVPSDTPGIFKWSENISVSQIPDIPLKGMINGKDINFEYINFENWRGTNDNVLNFGDKAPKQNCGYIENDNAFHLTKLKGNFTEGEFVKDSFGKILTEYSADYHITENGEINKTSVPWNCALLITEINAKTVKGKIAMCFKDEKKSWIAGNFAAIRCFN